MILLLLLCFFDMFEKNYNSVFNNVQVYYEFEEFFLKLENQGFRKLESISEFEPIIKSLINLNSSLEMELIFLCNKCLSTFSSNSILSNIDLENDLIEIFIFLNKHYLYIKNFKLLFFAKNLYDFITFEIKKYRNVRESETKSLEEKNFLVCNHCSNNIDFNISNSYFEFTSCGHFFCNACFKDFYSDYKIINRKNLNLNVLKINCFACNNEEYLDKNRVDMINQNFFNPNNVQCIESVYENIEDNNPSVVTSLYILNCKRCNHVMSECSSCINGINITGRFIYCCCVCYSKKNCPRCQTNIKFVYADVESISKKDEIFNNICCRRIKISCKNCHKKLYFPSDY